MRTIAAFVAGVVLAVCGTAVAQSGYWQQDGPFYSCDGISVGVQCKSGGYLVGVTKGYVFIQHIRTGNTYGCPRWRAYRYCYGD